MRADVRGCEVVFELDGRELARLHAAARRLRGDGGEVTDADVRRVVERALDSFCREVAATRRPCRAAGADA